MSEQVREPATSRRPARLRDRVPVEPLDGARLDRLEHRVVAEARPLLARPRRASWTPWLVAGSAALAAAAVVLVLGVGRRDHASPLPAPAPVMVATDGHGTRIDLGDAVVDVGPDTRFEVVRAAGGIAIELATGDVRLEVPPRHARPPLWVHAGDVGVRVVGTGFRVHRGATTDVEVTHGVVEVHRGPALARVATGERWSSTDGAVVAMTALAADHDHAADSAASTASTTAAGAGIGPSTIAADALALGPTATGPGLHDRRQPALPGGPAMPTATGDTPAVRTTDRPRPRVAPPLPPTGPAIVVGPPPDLRAEVLAVAVNAAPPLAAGDASTPEKRAIAYQRSLIGAKGADAAAAMYGLAYTQAALGKDSDALRSLDGYVARFPAGAQTEAVLWLRVRLLCKRQLDEPCRAAAHTYLARFPGGARGALAQRLTQSR